MAADQTMGKNSNNKVRRRESETDLPRVSESRPAQRRWLRQHRKNEEQISRSDAASRATIDGILREYSPAALLVALAEHFCKIYTTVDSGQRASAGIASRAATLVVHRYIDAPDAGASKRPSVKDIGRLFNAVHHIAPPAVFSPPTGVEHLWQLLAPLMMAQRRFQFDPFRELARTTAVLLDNHVTMMPRAEDWRRVLGIDVDEFVAVGFGLAALSLRGSGWIPIADAVNVVSRVAGVNSRTAQGVLTDHFVADRTSLAASRMRTKRHSVEGLEPWGFNPLQERPLIAGLKTGAWLCPVPQFCQERVSLTGLYFDGLKFFEAGSKRRFSAPLGFAFQDYVGEVLGTFREVGTTLVPEFKYRNASNDEVDSLDFFVIFDELVLLVEVKARRTIEKARLGDLAGLADLREKLNEGTRQISDNVAALETRNEAFQGIPTDRPHFGLVVTADDFGIVQPNGLLSIVEPASVSTQVLYIGELEHLCEAATSVANLGQALLESFTAQRSVALIASGLQGRRLACLESWWDRCESLFQKASGKGSAHR